MHITVLGAGALGVYFGGRLQESGHDVTFLVREGRAKQIEESGLKIHSVKGDFTFKTINIAKKPDDIPYTDIVLLSVKGYHIKGTIPALKSLVNQGAKVLPVLNGVEHFEILKQELGEENVLGGLSYIIATLDEHGHVVHGSQQHSIVFGELHESQKDICQKLSAVFTEANMDYAHNRNILEVIWEKYMFITSFSAITSAADLPIGAIRSHPGSIGLYVKMLNEMKQLANSLEIALTDEHVQKAIDQMDSFPDQATSSMHQDKRKGLPLELEYLQGAALRLAEKMQLQLPTINVIYHLLKPYENGKPE